MTKLTQPVLCVEVIGYQKHNGVTTPIMFKKEDYIIKPRKELEEFRKHLGQETGEEVYLCYREMGQ